MSLARNRLPFPVPEDVTVRARADPPGVAVRFDELKLSEDRLAAIEAIGWTVPTPIQVKAIRPERDALEIRFPRVAGYRVELPEERLTAAFNEDSDRTRLGSIGLLEPRRSVFQAVRSSVFN